MFSDLEPGALVPEMLLGIAKQEAARAVERDPHVKRCDNNDEEECADKCKCWPAPDYYFEYGFHFPREYEPPTIGVSHESVGQIAVARDESFITGGSLLLPVALSPFAAT